jgi:hypothetical protein
MKLIYVRLDDPCCPNTTDVSVSGFTHGSLNMRDAVAANRRIAHFYLVPDDFDITNISLETWLKAPAHAHAEPPHGLDGLVQIDVLLGDRIEDIARLSNPGESPVISELKELTANKVKRKIRKTHRR